MKSPFPGMDPYIEACGLWGDFQPDLIAEMKRALAPAIPERYLVRTGERLVIKEDYRENFIEIYESGPEHRLVTCLEVLSPSNKCSDSTGREVYLRKRRGLLLDQINLVEIDLLRGGQRMPMLDPWPDSPYTLLVARYKYVTRCLVWKAHYLRPLPTIKIPLQSPDPDIPLDLQPMIEAIYAQSRYDHSIDYSKPLTPSLNPEETAWLEQQLHTRQQ
jgi:Protein of unknown function (DUF4058)